MLLNCHMCQFYIPGPTAIKNNLIKTGNIDVVSLIDLLNNCSISFSFNSNNQNVIKLDDISVEDEIRTFEISNNVS